MNDTRRPFRLNAAGAPERKGLYDPAYEHDA